MGNQYTTSSFKPLRPWHPVHPNSFPPLAHLVLYLTISFGYPLPTW